MSADGTRAGRLAAPVVARPRGWRRGVAAALVTCGAFALGGCVEVDEDWKFARDGSGTYEVTVRWNANLLTLVKGAVGAEAVTAFEGRAFPLRLDEWREGLKPLAHV